MGYSDTTKKARKMRASMIQTITPEVLPLHEPGLYPHALHQHVAEWSLGAIDSNLPELAIEVLMDVVHVGSLPITLNEPA